MGPEDDDHGVWPTDPSADAATAEQLMRQLADCLLEPQGAGLDCPLAQTLITPSSRQPHASLYVGVLHGVPPNPQVGVTGSSQSIVHPLRLSTRDTALTQPSSASTPLTPIALAGCVERVLCLGFGVVLCALRVRVV